MVLVVSCLVVFLVTLGPLSTCSVVFTTDLLVSPSSIHSATFVVPVVLTLEVLRPPLLEVYLLPVVRVLPYLVVDYWLPELPYVEVF